MRGEPIHAHNWKHAKTESAAFCSFCAPEACKYLVQIYSAFRIFMFNICFIQKKTPGMQPPRGFCYAQYTQQFPTLLHTVRKVLADFAECDWWHYCKALCDVKFCQIAGNGRKFSHIELSNIASSVEFSDSVEARGGVYCVCTVCFVQQSPPP